MRNSVTGMTPRQRTLAAIRHEEPDRVPVDFGATPSSGISGLAYHALAEHLKISDSRTLVYDVVQQLAQPEEWFLDRFGIDIVDIGRSFNDTPDDWKTLPLFPGKPIRFPAWFTPREAENGAWEAFHSDGTMIATMPRGATFFDQSVFPWIDGYPDDLSGMTEAMDKVLWSYLVHSPWDNAHMDNFWEELRARALKMRETSDRALMIVCGCNLFEWGTFMRRMDNFLMDLYTDQYNVARFLDALMEIHISTLEKVCEAVGDVVDVIRFGDDLGMDNGPFMSLEVYNTLFSRHRKTLCDYVHKNSSMHTFIHTCGSVYQFLPSLIKEGIEIINPVQTNCRDMEPERLKREFGKELVFWGGGADTRSVLNGKDLQKIKDDVKYRMEIFAPGGGFIFNTVHNIMPDVPPSNILAMFEAVAEFNGTA